MSRKKKNVATISIKSEPKRNLFELPVRVSRMFKIPQRAKSVTTKKFELDDTIRNKKLYFLDITALVYYAGPLYGGFLVKDQFRPECIIPGEDSIFITDEQTLSELQKLEENNEQKIYKGYKAFVERSLVVISNEESMSSVQNENILKKEFSPQMVVDETKPYAHTIGSLYFLYHKNLEPILVTSDISVEDIARERGFEVHKFS